MNLGGFGAHLPKSPCMFYSNSYEAIDLIKYKHIIGNIFDENIVLALSHQHDIAAIAFDAIHNKKILQKCGER